MDVMQCPKCGAPVEMTGDAVTCSYCGTHLERPKPEVRERVIERVVTVPEYRQAPAYRPATPNRAGAIAGSLFVVISLIAMIGGIAYFTGGSSGKKTLNNLVNDGLAPYVSGDAVSFAREDGGTPDVLVRAMDLKSEQVRVIDLDGQTQAERWESQPLSKEGGRTATILAAGDLVYINDQASVLALDGASGAVRWQVSLANALPATCDTGCFQILGGALVALTRDGTLQAFDAQTGKPLWSQRLNSTPSRFVTTGERVLVMDVDKQGSSNGITLLLDARSGATTLRLEPHCDDGMIKRTPSSSDQLMVSPDGKALYILYTWVKSCTQRYDLGNGELVWSNANATPEMWLPGVFNNKSSLFTPDAIYLTSGTGGSGWVARIDTQTGQMSHFDPDKRYELSLEGVTSETLIVSARPEYDREQVELWGLDPSTGARRWQDVLKAHGSLSKWQAQLIPQGLALAQCVYDDAQCTFEVLSPESGVSSGQLKIDKEHAYAQFEHATWTGRLGLFIIGGKLYAVDLAKQVIAYQWPE